MKKLFQLFVICILCISFMAIVNAQIYQEFNTVEGSIWINPYLRSSEVSSEKVSLLVEKVTENNYRLCSQIGAVKLFTMMAFEKNCESEQPCGLSFNENCELICNSDCSYVNALAGNPEKMPLATYHTADFPNTSCFQKINNTHWYAYKTLEFVRQTLGFNNIGIGNTQTVYARYSPSGHWGNSNADDFGVTMNGPAANWPDAICHEWGHYLNNQITDGAILHDNGSIETQAIDEGLADIWSTLVRLYLENGENIEEFKVAKPDYRIWAVNRNFANTYKPYNTCNVLSDNLPSSIQVQAWTGGDSHTKGLTLSHWFYLLSEGTNNQIHTVRLEVPENEIATLTSSLCNNPNFATQEKTIQFRIEGIGHWNSLQIVYKALSIIAADESLQPLTFLNFRCATEQAVAAIFPNDCHVLQQLGNAWSALNVGESHEIFVSENISFCEGDKWTFSLQNDAMQSIELYGPNGDLLANGKNIVNFEIENLNQSLTGAYQIKYSLAQNCKGELEEACEWVKEIAISIENLPIILATIPPQAICETEYVSLKATDFIVADSYEWRAANGELVGEEAVLVFEPTATMVLLLVGKSECGSQTLTADIEVHESPQLTEILLETNDCQSNEAVLWVDALYDTYDWNIGNGAENALNIFEAGTYTLTVSNEYGCSTNMSIEVGEEDFPDLSVDFEVGYIVSDDEVWTDQNRRVNGKLVVQSGRTLEIEGIEVEFLSESSGIVVEEGAILKVKDVVLQGSKCESRAWRGILAKGDAYKTQNQLSYQAQVFLIDTKIQDAYIGVEMGDGYSNGFVATGGGVLVAKNTQFVDNSVGILFHAYLNESQSHISENCAFVFSRSFKGTHHLGDLGYVGILAINIGGIEVRNSTFKSEKSNEWSEIDRGTGIVSWHAPMRIGTGDEMGQNHFLKLYKGIDAYSTSTILGYMLIEGNRFEEVTKGVHLQYNHFSSVVGNRFENMAAANGYGLYAQKAEGLTIANNTFEAASVAEEASPNWGVIIENSGYYGCTVYNNEFTKKESDDKFFAAIQFEGEDNPNTLIDCNRFEPISHYDLLLLGDSNRYFSEQGGCDEFDPLISPLKNQWHTLCDNLETFHLYHNNVDVSLNWTFVSGYEPSCYSNNVQPIMCEDDDNDCSLGGFGQMSGRDGDAILNNLETAITSKERNLAIGQLVRYHLKTKELPIAIRTLEQDRQSIPNNRYTSIWSGKETPKTSLPIFSRTWLTMENSPQKPESGEENVIFMPQKRAAMHTFSTQKNQIRTANTALELENSHIKVKFNHSMNHFEGLNVAIILTDMNGRIVHHRQIEENHGEYIVDVELLMERKYICSVWSNGRLIKSRKFSLTN